MSVEDYRDLLDISDATYEKDKKKLEKIWSITEKQFLNKLKAEKIPETLDYIVPLVLVKRYNRLGYEGIKQHSQSEENVQYDLDDFAEYQSEIEDYLEAHSLVRKRKVSFI